MAISELALSSLLPLGDLSSAMVPISQVFDVRAEITADLDPKTLVQDKIYSFLLLYKSPVYHAHVLVNRQV